MPRERREQALEAARGCIEASALAGSSAATSPQEQVVVVRVLAPLVEPAMALLQAIRSQWRQQLWQLPATQPRGWAL